MGLDLASLPRGPSTRGPWGARSSAAEQPALRRPLRPPHRRQGGGWGVGSLDTEAEASGTDPANALRKIRSSAEGGAAAGPPAMRGRVGAARHREHSGLARCRRRTSLGPRAELSVCACASVGLQRAARLRSSCGSADLQERRHVLSVPARTRGAPTADAQVSGAKPEAVTVATRSQELEVESLISGKTRPRAADGLQSGGSAQLGPALRRRRGPQGPRV